MLKLKILFLLLFAFGTALFAQKLTINGKIDNQLKVDSLRFRYATNFIDQQNLYGKGEEVLVKVQHGRFQIHLDSLPTTFYAIFLLPKNYSKDISDDYRLIGNIGYIFMLKADIPVEIQLSQHGVIFSGGQKSSLDCQLKLFRLKKKLSDRLIAHKNSFGSFNKTTTEKQISDYLDTYKSINLNACREAEELVDSYAHALDTMTANTVYYDFIGSTKWNEINRINWWVEFSPDNVRSYVARYYNKYYTDELSYGDPKSYRGASNEYPKFLAYKAFTDLSNSMTLLGRRIKSNLALSDLLISERYTGNLYDQVAFSSLLMRATKEYVDDMYLISLIGNMKNEDFKLYANDLRKKRTIRTKSFQFKLEDENGKMVTNADFIGKVVLFDFWFTGCKGCLALHKNMAPVKAHFKNNPNFKYVSISIDKKRVIWLNSLQKGEYTDKTDVKLWTNEQGDKHPIIRYYEIGSYPTMILIGKNDEVIAMNPPNPYTERNKNALIKMISDALNE
ncbi:TlpA disulfide reductase family protein [Sphingobacterium sp.]|uniref:TlpA family protein disulfide reductase n=1 Tax=Sphingobacterium sp. TaxID=341027 RepID=UPI00289C2321|nr:TlpA disulfide reductase family protein [Sphingobacterium sp.]